MLRKVVMAKTKKTRKRKPLLLCSVSKLDIYDGIKNKVPNLCIRYGGRSQAKLLAKAKRYLDKTFIKNKEHVNTNGDLEFTDWIHKSWDLGDGTVEHHYWTMACSGSIVPNPDYILRIVITEIDEVR